MIRRQPGRQTESRSASGWAALGRNYARQYRFYDAATCFGEALKRQPAAELYCDLAQILILCGRMDDALEAAQQAVALNPKLALAHCHVGTVMRRRGRLLQAKRAFEAALSADPQCFDAMHKLANVASQLCLWEDAISWFVRALELNPAAADVHSSLLFTLTISGVVGPERLLEEHVRWAEMHKPTSPVFPRRSARADPARRLRIGFVSADLRDHPVKFFIAPVLRGLDRAEFDIICYSATFEPDASTEQLRLLADGWRDVSRDTDAELTQRVRRDGIDVLVDLSGHTTAHRLRVFQNRPAPVQVTYLGYPNTTGLASMDYWITDQVLHPEDTLQKTSETIWRLPRCWVAYDPPRDAPDPEESNRNTDVTVASFNALQKLSPHTIRLWARVLNAMPCSRLLLKAGGLDGAEEQALVRDRFAGAGISPHRVEIMGQVASMREHLSLYSRADVALDTNPFSGGTTTAEALWMGVPVVTLAGGSMISRMTASMLRAVDLDEWIASDENQFVRIACDLAGRPHWSNSRRELRARVAGSPLCDGAGLSHVIGQAFRQMWQQWCER